MPTYSYICKKCQHRLEMFQKITDPKLTECPKCKNASLYREVGGHTALFRFKGSGFYETDYKKSPNGEEKGACQTCGKPGGSCASG